ncbi:MAG: collagen-like protein, partial [Gillisia sp.]|nr:collagen-like protein [Gillisia sp.]
MKKFLTLLLISVFALTSCSNDGPVGPQGPQGPQGLEGLPGADGLIGTVIDLQGNFTSANDYSLVLDFNTEGIEV